MKNVKYMTNYGWDICEKKMLKKLSEFANEGWILDSMSPLRFKLIKGEPQSLVYEMDYQKDVEDKEEYRRIFQEAGWNLVCELDGFSIFSAPKGTVSLYTDKTNLYEGIKKRRQKVMLAWIISILMICFGLCVNITNVSLIVGLLGAMLFGSTTVWLGGLLINKRNVKKECM